MVSVGVGGFHPQVALAGVDDLSSVTARSAVRAWLPGNWEESATGLIRAEGFPYAVIVAHYRAVGRAHVNRELANTLRGIHELLVRPGQDLADSARVLAAWLPMTFDQVDGDYETYLGAAVLTVITAGEQTTEQIEDGLINALLADLAVTEAAGLAVVAPDRRRQQRLRTQASAHALAQRTTEIKEPRLTKTDPLESRDDAALAASLRATALAVLADTPVALRRAVTISLLPMTRLHDEHMFIRSIQMLEIIYRQVGRCLFRAITELAKLDVERSCAELSMAARRLEATPALYRVVTTMPKYAFAVIREYTAGRSAIQSRAYRRIEWLAAPATARSLDPALEKYHFSTSADATMQETFTSAAEQLSDAEAARVASSMARLDKAWRTMKRTHWGITRKIIGNQPGTGGTAGASYLARAAQAPLFPIIAERGLYDGRGELHCATGSSHQ